MKFKQLLLSLGLAAAMPLCALADAEDRAEDISKALKLDSTRAQQLEQIFENYADQHKVLKEQKHERLETLLTDDEMDQFKAMKKNDKGCKHKEWRKD